MFLRLLGRTDRQSENAQYQALEFARNIHSNMLETNRDLYTRAQWILTLDGLVVSLAAGRLLAAPIVLRPAIAEFTPVTWALLTGASLALIWSALGAILAIRSSYKTGLHHVASAVKIQPEQMWFFRHVAELSPSDYVEAGLRATNISETRARLSQAAAMAPNMLKRARWLNRSTFGAGLGIVLFALAVVDYIVSVQ
jgi:hypothetical protein